MSCYALSSCGAYLEGADVTERDSVNAQGGKDCKSYGLEIVQIYSAPQ